MGLSLAIRWSRGSDPRLLRLTLDKLPDFAFGERPRASKALPYPKARLADCNLFVLPGALICIKQDGAEGHEGRQLLMPLHGPTVYASAPPQTVMKIVTTL